MNALKEFIDRNQLPFADAAKLAGTSFTNIWRHYHGERSPSPGMIRRYHEAFKIPLEDLIQSKPIPAPAHSTEAAQTQGAA